MFIPFTFTSHYSRLHHITLWLFIFTLIHFTPYIILSQALFTLKTGEYVRLLAVRLQAVMLLYHIVVGMSRGLEKKVGKGDVLFYRDVL